MTVLNCAPAVVAVALDAAAARRQKGEAVPGQGRVRMVVAGAPPPSKTIERVEAELGWEFIQIYGLTETSPLLTINRAPAECDGLDAAERARRLSRAGVPAIGVQMRVDAEGEVLARVQPRLRGLLGTAGGDAPRRSTTAGSTPATAATSTTPTSSSPTARRT